MPLDEPPKTIREVGIVLSYMAKDMKDMKDTIASLPSGFASKDSVIEIDHRVTKLEKKNTLKNTLLWVGLVASAVINVIVIYRLFTGAGTVIQ